MSSKLESKGVTVLFNLEILKQASETDRQIANYIANNQESVAFMRVRELAEKNTRFTGNDCSLYPKNGLFEFS